MVLKRNPFISDGSDHGFRSDLNPDDGDVIPDQELTKRCEFLRRWISVVDEVLERKLQVEGVEDEARVVGDELGVAAQVPQVHRDWAT